MPLATFRVAPMPEPVSRYHAPSGSTPAAFQSARSFLWVPLSSPREANTAPAAAMFLRDANTSRPATSAGSASGPTITKSLYITSSRSTPCPSATNFSSEGLWWTRRTSASPLLAIRMALPVPTATTRTPMPVCSRNPGRRTSNSPEFSVEVVEATVMNRSCADTHAPVTDRTMTAAALHIPARSRFM